MKSGEGTLIAFATGPGQTALDLLGLLNPLRYASAVHRTDAVVAQALGVAFEALV